MTQIVTISANTAALNIEALRTPRRVSVKDQVADVKADADRNAKALENVSDPEAIDNMIPAIKVGIDVLTTGKQPQQQYSLQQVEAAYRDLED
ncbi:MULTISPECIES: hypothetical protein [Rhizobiaceae]|jgi:hypothetical protein|uniref:Uncharacterized protein n=2 Tax=Rhizobiaceae TaxID=82115 RepID=A0A7W4XHJ6_9HYPH|nr:MULTISPECIES: hypothetical protein [Rhizobium/Agrobacterium group]MBB4347478.1 hypothetical protein [Rhizobium cellulosilyticum]MBB4410127.1 hypothetical protein [Rhizobium cellulosilyticum]MBB4444814.1 hypothetical protein [Rhizobium cellulosilyticum]MBB6160739.1 hypothetical protein [Rhizobium wenxiniae]MBO0141971.1 hypothetical protein [Agrobacterium sp. Ap1]